MKQLVEQFGLTTVVVGFCVLLSIVVAGVYYAVAPYFVNQETKINLYSVGAYNTHVTQMNAYINEYSKLDLDSANNPAHAEANGKRQTYLVDQFCGVFVLIPPGVWENPQTPMPKNIYQFQFDHPCSGK